MSHFNALKSEAMGNFGVVTSKVASDIGIRGFELIRWVKDGRLLKVGRGVYRLADYPLGSDAADMISILAEVGEGAYLRGESVLGFLGLCPTRSYIATVAYPNRLRKKLPEGIQVEKSAADYKPTYYEGVPCQKVEDAIRSAKIDEDRIVVAIDAAEKKGYLIGVEADNLRKELIHG